MCSLLPAFASSTPPTVRAGLSRAPCQAAGMQRRPVRHPGAAVIKQRVLGACRLAPCHVVSPALPGPANQQQQQQQQSQQSQQPADQKACCTCGATSSGLWYRTKDTRQPLCRACYVAANRDRHVCCNCSASSSPQWYRTKDTQQPLCNACYLAAGRERYVCCTCGATSSPQWSRTKDTKQPLCRACYLAANRDRHMCSTCGATSSTSWHRTKDTKQPLCSACYSYKARTGRDRTEELWTAAHKVCCNCGTTTTCAWRHTKDTKQPLCNSCYQYQRMYGRPRRPPAERQAAAAASRVCCNCGTTNSSKWLRIKDPRGPLCQTCYAYQAKTGRSRPMHLQWGGGLPLEAAASASQVEAPPAAEAQP